MTDKGSENMDAAATPTLAPALSPLVGDDKATLVDTSAHMDDDSPPSRAVPDLGPGKQSDEDEPAAGLKREHGQADEVCTTDAAVPAKRVKNEEERPKERHDEGSKPLPAGPAATEDLARAMADRLELFEPVRKRTLVRPTTDGVTRRFSDILGDAILIEQQENGGSSVVHVYPDVLMNLSRELQIAFAKLCYDVIFAEDEDGDAIHVFGIIHDGAHNVPNALRYIAEHFPKTPIVRRVFGQARLTETLSIDKYVTLIDKTLECNTHRAGQMDAMSLVGCQKQEETGGYYEDVIKILEANHWLKDVLPWGTASRYDNLDPAESDDGPIMWACPGEQIVPLTELAAIEKGSGNGGEGAAPRRKRTDLDRLLLLPRNERPREKLVEDRTGAHADMAGLFPERHPVAAVGFVQGMNGTRFDLKDIIAFQACDMYRVADLCGLYFQEEAKDQLIDKELWINEAKLNHLRRMGVRYAHIRLKAGDVYFIPRKVVHQFKTVSACVSVTWHLKHRSYYKHLFVHPSVSENTPKAAHVVPQPMKGTTSAAPPTPSRSPLHVSSETKKTSSAKAKAPRSQSKKIAHGHSGATTARPSSTSKTTPSKAKKAPRRKKVTKSPKPVTSSLPSSLSNKTHVIKISSVAMKQSANKGLASPRKQMLKRNEHDATDDSSSSSGSESGSESDASSRSYSSGTCSTCRSSYSGSSSRSNSGSDDDEPYPSSHSRPTRK